MDNYKIKKLGQVFTPVNIINFILDKINFKNKNILDKKIIDPASGTGYFLQEVIKRIIETGKKNNLNVKEIINIINNNIYGIEIDKDTYKKCIDNIKQTISQELQKYYQYNIKNNEIKIKIYNQDTLKSYKNFLNFFDYVIGNPPYIRIQNLNNETRDYINKEFDFNKGNYDLYLIFFEIGIKLLKKNGKLGYITPNSFIKNSSYKNFRDYLKNKQIIKSLYNFNSYKVFEGYSTYTAITILSNELNEYFNYYEFKCKNKNIIEINNLEKCFKLINKIYYKNLETEWNLLNKKDEKFIFNILNKKNKVSEYFNVQYGITTLRDNIYIGKIKDYSKDLVLFKNKYLIEKEIVKPILKISKFIPEKKLEEQLEYIIYPYKKINNKIKVIDEEELSEKFPNTYKYLLKNKEKLLKRDLRDNTKWYEYGRNQGLNNISKKKIALSPIIYDKLKIILLDSNILMYSGIFITNKTNKYTLEYLFERLNSYEFLKYALLLGKNMANNYKNMNTKIIKNFYL